MANDSRQARQDRGRFAGYTARAFLALEAAQRIIRDGASLEVRRAWLDRVAGLQSEYDESRRRWAEEDARPPVLAPTDADMAAPVGPT